MNAISFYISASRIVLQTDSSTVDQKWSDLYRLVPYLRQSLSCAVCCRLLIDPYSPKDKNCQHHVCRQCVRGKKNIKPLCNLCHESNDFKTYEENKQVRIILQCYKNFCEHLMSTQLYTAICNSSKTTGVISTGIIIPNLSLVEFIEEGANFEDVFSAFAAKTSFTKSNTNVNTSVLTKPPLVVPRREYVQQQSQNFIKINQQLPPLTLVNKSCLLNTSSGPTTTTPVSTSTLSQVQIQHQNHNQHFLNQHKSAISTSNSISTLPRVIQTSASQTEQKPILVTAASIVGTSNSSSGVKCIVSTAPQLTQIRQQPPIKTVSNGSAMYSVLYTGIGNKITIKRKTNGDEENMPRKISMPTIVRQIVKPNSKRRGCRCGNATMTPGKLTCCGQRCPCYVDSKSCIDCKCRGCRNPHRPDGGKVRPVIPQLACYEIQMADDSTNLTTQQVPIATGNMTTGPTTSINTNRLELPIKNLTKSKITVTPVSTSSGTTMTLKKQPQTLTFTTNSIQKDQNVVHLDNMSTESPLIQSADGKYQVVNVFTSTPHQTTNNIQRIHSITTVPSNNMTNNVVNNSIGSTILLQNPNTTHLNTTSVHQIPNITTTLPQIIMQQQQQQHQTYQTSSANTTTTSSSFATQQTRHLLLRLLNQPQQNQQQMHSNVITMHPLTNNHHLSTHLQHHPQSNISLSPTPTTITLFPSEIFTDEDFITSTSQSQGHSSSPLSLSHPPLVELLETHSGTDL